MKLSKNRLAISVIFIVFLILFATALKSDLVIQEYSIESDKISNDSEITIVLVTDLHSYIYGEDQSYISRKISEQNPDIIALSGDIGDRNRSIDGAELFIDSIKDIAPVYYVTGNHEFDSGEVDYIKKLFKSDGVIVLEGESKETVIKGQKIIIGGLDDPNIVQYRGGSFDWETESIEAFERLEMESGYKILLSHRPEYVELYGEMPFDLVLSGHAHGGQVRIPGVLNGLFAPNQGFFPKYAGGFYRYDGITHIISRGVVVNPLRPRVFNPPEIVTIKLK